MESRSEKLFAILDGCFKEFLNIDEPGLITLVVDYAEIPAFTTLDNVIKNNIMLAEMQRDRDYIELCVKLVSKIEQQKTTNVFTRRTIEANIHCTDHEYFEKRFFNEFGLIVTYHNNSVTFTFFE